MAIVSRVEGTYEFEVQPLREYFAARYLYETAPYSPPGNERKGTKPERFDAIAKNFYWLNVTRFYAGCYSVGELPSLIDRIQDLINDPDYNLIRHPRSLAAMLLSDWVFTQHPKSVQQIVKIILSGLGLRRLLLASYRRVSYDDSLILTSQNGKDELVEQCFAVLDGDYQFDYIHMVLDLISSNASKDDIIKLWNIYLEKNKNLPNKWLEYGLNLGVLSNINIDEFSIIVNKYGINDTTLSLMVRAKRFKLIESDNNIMNRVVNVLLDNQFAPYYRMNPTHGIEVLHFIITFQNYSTCFRDANPEPLIHRWVKRFGVNYDKFLKAKFNNELYDDKLEKTISVVQNEIERPMQEWASSILPWSNLVEGLRKIWGNHWSFVRLANLSGGVKIQPDLGLEYDNLFNDNADLCLRVRYARSKAGVQSWWHKQSDQIRSKENKIFFAVVISTWAGPTVLTRFLDELNSTLVELDEQEWSKVYITVSNTISATRVRRFKISLQGLADRGNNYDYRTLTLIKSRLSEEDQLHLYKRLFINYRGNDIHILQWCQRSALLLVSSQPTLWEQTLEVISHAYNNGVYYFDEYIFRRDSYDVAMPIEIAKDILSSPLNYPAMLVNVAEQIYSNAVASKIIPVGTVANNQKWFD